MLNVCTIMGRMVADPELKRTTSGKSVTNFTLAADRDFKGPNGEKETDFFEVVAWGNTAEFITKYFGKGRMAIVAGRLQSRAWTDSNGNKRKTWEIVADNVYFGDSKTETTKAYSEPASDSAYSDADDELPF